MKNAVLIAIAVGALAWAGSAEESEQTVIGSFLFVSN